MKLSSSGEASSFLQLLGTLYLLFFKMRREGLISVEVDADNPLDSVLFNEIATYDKTNEVVYTFVCDVLHLMLSGEMEIENIQFYMDAYVKTTTLTIEQAALFDCARLAFRALLSGSSPYMATEYGRHGIPAKDKPSYQQLNEFIHGLRNKGNLTMENIEVRLVEFYASLDEQ